MTRAIHLQSCNSFDLLPGPEKTASSRTSPPPPGGKAQANLTLAVVCRTLLALMNLESEDPSTSLSILLPGPLERSRLGVSPSPHVPQPQEAEMSFPPWMVGVEGLTQLHMSTQQRVVFTNFPVLLLLHLHIFDLAEGSKR